MMLILPSANQIFFRAVTPGSPDSGSKLDTAYVEFANGRTVPPADIVPSTLRTYFDSLAASPDQDYLRVPVLAHSPEQAPDGRPQLTLVIATDGSTGVHGKSFSSAVKSRIYAVTLAASQLNDRDDVFAARHHYEVVEQIEKPDSGHVTLIVTLR